MTYLDRIWPNENNMLALAITIPRSKRQSLGHGPSLVLKSGETNFV